MPILDLGAVLMAHGTYSSNQSFPPILLYPRQLPSCTLTIHLLTPPVASAVFTVEVAATQNGVYSASAVVTWPAGVAGARQLTLGVNGSRAWMANHQSLWVRLSLTTSGALTGSAWVTKAADGGIGTGSDVGDVLTGAAAL
jgi:hypothetical protein